MRSVVVGPLSTYDQARSTTSKVVHDTMLYYRHLGFKIRCLYSYKTGVTSREEARLGVQTFLNVCLAF